jgi:Tfp pilus assembly protein PilF
MTTTPEHRNRGRIPPSAGAAWLLALVCAATGCARTPGAEIERRVEIAQREHEPSRLLRSARAFADIGDYTRAEQYIDAARQQGAEEAEVLPLLLEVCIKDRRYRAAAQHAEEHLRKQPSAYPLRFMLATLYIGLAENDAARRELERVLRLAPEHAEAHYALALLLRDELGHPSEADRHFREYLRLQPHGDHADEAGSSLLSRVP